MITLPHNNIQGGGRVPMSLYEIIRALNLEANLSYCYDAGDVRSYAGGTQRWKDLSGNGNDLYLGNSDVVGYVDYDPTFQGTVDARSANEYFLGASTGSHFLQVGTPTFDNDLHKAGALFSFVAVVGGQSANWTLAGNATSVSIPGISLRIAGTRRLQLIHTTTNVPANQTVNGVNQVPSGNPAVMTAMFSYNDAGLATIMKADNAAFESIASTASTCTLAATHEWGIGNDGSLAGAPSGSDFSNPARYYAAAGWTGVALSGATMDLLRAALKDNRWPALT
jgi:hypothetical protein